MEIQGRIESIVYHNDGNGYSVLRVEAEDDLITCVGYGYQPEKNLDYIFQGDWIFHPKYQEQFSFQEAKALEPSSQESIVRYLSSGCLPFIGPKTAQAIVDLFGQDSLRVMKEEPGSLRQIPGLGKKKIAKISQALKEQEGMDIMVNWCLDRGLSIQEAMKLYRVYGENTQTTLEKKPYWVLQDLKGLSFKTIDKIALKLGFAKDDPMRIGAYFVEILKDALFQGNCYVYYSQLKSQFSKDLGLDPEKAPDPLQMAMNPSLYLEKAQEAGWEGDYRVYLSYVYQCEKNIAQNLLARLGQKNMQIKTAGQAILQDHKKDWINRLSPEQIQAVEKSLDSSVMVLTGGPGTGKTTTLKALIELYESMDLKVCLAAPTGRAAKKMSEATSRPASTIHRLLDLTPHEDWVDFQDTENEIDADVLVLDEVSMVDIFLMVQILLALEEKTKLILVGDHNQLPSVGPGNVLGDIIASGRVPTVELTKIFRQAEQSNIVQNAHNILKDRPLLMNQKNGDFFFIQAPRQDIAQTIVDLISKRLPDYYDLDPMEDIQVLSPMHKGPVGVSVLNQRLQEALNPPGEDKKEITYKKMIFRTGDRVMHIKNNYQLKWSIQSEAYSKEGEGVFNGDLGRILSVDPEAKSLKVVYDEMKIVDYQEYDLDELTLAYASTIHKAQGSEYPITIMTCSWAPAILQSKNILYTAITRGKRGVILVGSLDSLQEMLKNKDQLERRTGLVRRLETEGVL